MGASAQALALFGVRSGMRPWIERLDPATYLGLPYYARWLLAGERGVVAKGVVTADDLRRWYDVFVADVVAVPPVVTDDDRRRRVEQVMTSVDRLRPATATRFVVGDTVVVRRWRDTEHHHRCPRYVRGVAGLVESVCGDDPVPGREDDLAPLYTVAFSSVDLWGSTPEPPFVVFVDLCEEYLDAPDEEAGVV